MKKILIVFFVCLCFLSCGESKATLPMVIKVGRTDCIPCRKMTALLNELKPKLEGKAEIQIINLEEDPDAREKYNIGGIPTILFLDVEGKEIYRQTGILTEETIILKLKEAGANL